MMLVYKQILQDGDARRMGVSAFGALAFHALILVWFALPVSKNLISADLYSPPTNVTIRFTQAVQEKIVVEKPVQDVKAIEPIKKNPVQKTVKLAAVKPKPEALNAIEPAAYEPTQKLVEPRPVEPIVMTPPKPAPESILIVTEVNLKGRRVRPQYPKRALRMRQEGVVWLRVLVDAQGTQEDLKVHKPSQYALLNQAAVKAVRKWEFEPTQRFGRTVKSWVEIPIEFSIQ